MEEWMKDDDFLFPPSHLFGVIFCFRIISAFYLHIVDCDETYNYWEPSHYLLFGKGFQSWEYSPQFALRSYFYILIYNGPAWIFNELFHPGRLFLFYLTRCCLAACCAGCETLFYRSVVRKFHSSLGIIMSAILLFSPGMFIASSAFLPSSFSMHMTMLSLSSWFNKNYPFAIFFVAVSSLLSWPFAGIIGAPIAYEMVFLRKRWREFLKWCILSAIIILIPLLLIDSAYYGKFTLTPWNIVKYNIFTPQRSNLHGESPWYFYILNGFLNFNIFFLFALSMPFLLIWLRVARWRSEKADRWPENPSVLLYDLCLGSLYLWFIVFFTQTHKEERFLFPVYPLIALCGAVGIDRVAVMWYRYEQKTPYFYYRSHSYYTCRTMVISCIPLICYIILGVSRILLLYKGYHAPMEVYGRLKTVETNMTTENDVTLCIGKEWHRFPSSYFLPDGQWTVKFMKSEFQGQLPAHYLTNEEATKIVRTDMNGLNNEDVSRYVNLDACNYFVDTDSASPTPLEPIYSSHPNWTSVYSMRFLDACRTPLYVRFFYIPILWEWQSSFTDYHLLVFRPKEIEVTIFDLFWTDLNVKRNGSEI